MSDIPIGYCQCGCGNKTPICKKTDGRRHTVKGQPSRYLMGHTSRKNKREYIVDESSGCWLWQLKKDKHGYGYKGINGKHLRAHRYIYERHKGKIPEGLQLDHLCRNHSCVNPDHLEPVTVAENNRRGIGTKITIEQAHQIKQLLQQHMSLTEVGKRFGLTSGAISRIAVGRNWKDA